MMHKRNSIGLVIVDVQGKLAELMFEKDKLINNLQILIRGAKLLEIPIIWMEQVPDKLGPTIPEISELLTDMKPIIKKVFSCAKNDQFINRIKKLNLQNILLAGIEAHVCIYQTALDLLEEGYHVEVIADAVSSRTDFNKQIGLDRILLAGGAVTSVETILFELQMVAEGARFRELIKLVK